GGGGGRGGGGGFGGSPGGGPARREMASTASTEPDVRPPVSSGGRVSSMIAGSAPSMPRIRMARVLSSAITFAASAFSNARPARSRIRGLPAKNPGERVSHWSSSASQSGSGSSGLSTSARKLRPRNRNETRRIRGAIVTVAFPLVSEGAADDKIVKEELTNG